MTISAHRHRHKRAAVGFAVLTLILSYALVQNIIEKPDGIAISGLFILGIVVVSLVSRISRTTELRVEHIEFDLLAREFIEASVADNGPLHIIANKRQAGDEEEYAAKEAGCARTASSSGPKARQWRTWCATCSSAVGTRRR